MNNFWETSAIAKTKCKAYNNFVPKTFLGGSSANPRWFFSNVKTKRCENFELALLRENGTIVIVNAKKVCVMNNQIFSVFTKEDLQNT